jgi:hypothetical protein
MMVAQREEKFKRILRETRNWTRFGADWLNPLIDEAPLRGYYRDRLAAQNSPWREWN